MAIYSYRRQDVMSVSDIFVCKVL